MLKSNEPSYNIFLSYSHIIKEYVLNKLEDVKFGSWLNKKSEELIQTVKPLFDIRSDKILNEHNDNSESSVESSEINEDYKVMFCKNLDIWQMFNVLIKDTKMGA